MKSRNQCCFEEMSYKITPYIHYHQLNNGSVLTSSFYDTVVYYVMLYGVITVHYNYSRNEWQNEEMSDKKLDPFCV